MDWSGQVFDTLRRDQPEVLNKLVPIAGDMSMPGLGVSAGDVKILADNVSVVFHSAATVKFDEALKSAVEMNLKGTKRLLELCRKMDRLEVTWTSLTNFLTLTSTFGPYRPFHFLPLAWPSFDSFQALIHVSTAYANCDKEEIAEIIYPPPADPKKLMECVDWMDEDLLKNITQKSESFSSFTHTHTHPSSLWDTLHLSQKTKQKANTTLAVAVDSVSAADIDDDDDGGDKTIFGKTFYLVLPIFTGFYRLLLGFT